MLWIDMAYDSANDSYKSAEGLTVGDVVKCFKNGDLVYVHIPEHLSDESERYEETVELLTEYIYREGAVSLYRFGDYGGSSLDDVFASVTS